MSAQPKIPNWRCSSLPRICECTASIEYEQAESNVRIDSKSEVSRLGDASHEFYAPMILNSLNDPGDLFDLATKHNVNEAELRMLCWNGIREWKKIRDRIDVWNVEGKMGHTISSAYDIQKPIFKLTGHPDVIGRLKDDTTTAVIIDWKTGYKEAAYIPQLKGYALLDLHIYGNPNHPRFKEEREFSIPMRYLLVVVWTRLGFTETFEFQDTDIMDFREELINIFQNETKTYSPSDSNCMYCPMAGACPARREFMQSAGRDLLAIAGDNAKHEITHESLVKLYSQSRMLKKAVTQYENALKQAVDDAGGKLIVDGEELSFEESETTKYKNNRQVLSDYLTQEQIDELFITKKDLESAIRENAPRGQGGKRIVACLDALKDAGACSTSTKKTLKYQKI